jgi:hypothetical protein
MTKMKTDKQQMVILMLLVIPIMLMIVTTTTMINKANAFGETRDREGDFNDGGFLAGMSAGKAQAVIDERSGIDNNSCEINHSNAYCEGYGIGYAAEHGPFNLIHGK